MFRLVARLMVGILMTVSVLSAAPIPKESPKERLQHLFGTVFDPDQDCEITLVERRQLRIRVPGKHHSMYGDVGHTNAPRVMRTVSGDFVAQVRVRVQFDKLGLAVDQGLPPAAGGGLLLMDDDKGVVEFRTLQEKIGSNPWRTAAECDVRLPGFEAGNSIPRPLEEMPVLLRLTRKQGRLFAEWSSDGKTWTAANRNGIEVPLSKRVTLGVYAIQNTDKPMSIHFEEFHITPLATDD
ncbi:MAG: DUF1349 domain-containing protein [Bacteroidales bacterium]|nr:DUF1349 domain-containing protein [Bacteroidales bacterium]